ncbi:MAG: polymer-forming cytoskeletal protein [Polaromonas sp.]|nr:polymer-forming cytoskeletal protein [Polaromonas sp.]
MFGKKAQPSIRSLIAQGSCIEGNLKFTDGLRIDGEVIGDIRANEGSPSILVISESACVTGQIYADHVIINGRVMGPVHAAELLELQPKAKIQGDVTYKALEMHQGAVIFGQLQPTNHEVSEKPLLKLAANNVEKAREEGPVSGYGRL